jgi:hypothetical protein
MTREIYTVTVTDETGRMLVTRQRFAMNSGIRTSEALVGDIARRESAVAIYHGAAPQRVADTYTRVWTSPNTGRVLTAQVSKAS